ncbi:MAG: T9SS type A sorting domain-containing protein [Saprospiraceae bacterium]
MKAQHRLLILSILLLFCYIGRAQPYHLTVTSRQYQDLTGASPLVTGIWDDPSFTVPLGYNIEFFGATVNTIYSPNVFVGGVFTTNLDANSLNLIAAFSADLVDRGYNINTPLSPISFKTVTLGGRKTTTIEYKNAGFLGDSTPGVRPDFVNFQLKVFEGTDDIEVHIGPSSITNQELDFQGFPGPEIGLVQGYNLNNGGASGEVFLLSGDPLNPVINTTFIESYLNWPIPDNTVYTFSRSTSAVHDENYPRSVQYYYPNPGIERIRLRPELTGKIISDVVVINSDGVTLKTEHPGDIDLEGLVSGIYILRFQTDDGPAIQRICVLK